MRGLKGLWVFSKSEQYCDSVGYSLSVLVSKSISIILLFDAPYGGRVKFTWGSSPFCLHITRLLQILLLDIKTIASLFRLLCLAASTQFLFAPHQPKEKCYVSVEIGWGHAGRMRCPRETHTGFQPDYFKGHVHLLGSIQLLETKSCSRQTGSAVEVIKVNCLSLIHYYDVWFPFSAILLSHRNTLMCLRQHGFHHRELLMGIILVGTVYIFVEPDYLDWYISECLILCWLEFPPKSIRSIADTAKKVASESELERGWIKFTGTLKCSQ